jgi:adenylate cyclase
MPNFLRRYDIIVAVLLFIAAVPAQVYEWMAPIEEQTISLRQQSRMDHHAKIGKLASTDIFMVNTDEHFFQKYQSFPLRRTDIGKLASNLRRLGAKVVAIDILMDFPSSYNEDPALAQDLKSAGSTLLVNQGVVKDRRLVSINHPTKLLDEASASGYTNITSASSWTTSLYRLTLHPEATGMAGGWPFSVAAAAMYLGVEPKMENGKLILGDLTVPLDAGNNIYIDFPALVKGNSHLAQERGISAAEYLVDLDVMDPRDVDDLAYNVEGKLVIIGDTSEVSHDWFDTPVGNVYGVEIIADTIASILAGGPLQVVSLQAQLIAPVLGLIVVLISALFLRSPMQRGLLGLTFLIGFGVSATQLYVHKGLIVPMTPVLAATVMGALLIEFHHYMVERAQKKMISKTFGQYIPAELVEEMNKSGQQVSVGGESREMTVLFSDVRGFTTISEGLSPNALTQLMNAFLSPMTRVIQTHRGTIDKYMGDAIMAFWGAPLTDPDHARHAVQAGLAMVTTMNELADDFVARGWKPLKIGIGLNTGTMNVGNMGSDFRLAYTVLGDAVNLGSRIESLTKQYGVDVMISEFTLAAVPGLLARTIDLVRVKGKDEPVGLFEPIGFEGEVPPQTVERLARHAAAVAAYRAQNWPTAKSDFQALAAEEPNRLIYKIYLDRIANFEEHSPGPEWDGVYTHKEK